MVFLLITLGFLCGGVIGFMLFELFSVATLVVPAVMCFILSITYRLYRLRNTV